VVGGVLVVIRVVVVIFVRLAEVILAFFIGVTSPVVVALILAFFGWVFLVSCGVVGAYNVVVF
jgi:hypothetical protein